MEKLGIIEKLKNKNYRITKARGRLIDLFYEKEGYHFTINEIAEHEKIYGKVNIATLYNNLEFLETEEIIYGFSAYGTKYYEFINGLSHTHLICRHCQLIENIDISSNNDREDILRDYGFTVKSEIKTIFGCCKECQAGKCTECVAGCQSKINIVNDLNYEINEQEIRRYIDFLKSHFNDKKNLSLVFTDEKEIAQLNLFRDKNVPTDVLSFPFEDFEYLGDLIICYPIAQRQSKEYNHSLKREIFFLITHGFLHLQGYDHMTEKEEKLMFKLQEKLLDEYGIEREK